MTAITAAPSTRGRALGEPSALTQGKPRAAFLDNIAGAVIGLIAVSNLAQGMWLNTYPWLDLTSLGYALSLPFALAAIAVSGRRRGVGSLALLLFAVLFGFALPALNPGSFDKRAEIGVGVLYTLFAAFLVLSNDRRINAFLVTVVAVAVAVALGQHLMPDGLALALGRRTPAGLNPIGSGRALGAGTVLTLGMVSLPQSPRVRAVLLGSSTLFAAGLLATGSRGPALGALAGSAVILWAAPKMRRSMKILATAILGCGVYIALRELTTSGARIAASSDSGRTDLYLAAIRVASENPWGVGWGNFYNYIDPGLVNSYQGYKQYPHNIALEFLAEAGWVSALIFLLVTSRIIFLSIAQRDGFRSLRIAALLTFSSTSALFSSDIVGNRLLWVTLGAALATVRGAYTTRANSDGRSRHAKPLAKRQHLQDPSRSA